MSSSLGGFLLGFSSALCLPCPLTWCGTLCNLIKHQPAPWGKEDGRQVLSSWKSPYPKLEAADLSCTEHFGSLRHVRFTLAGFPFISSWTHGFLETLLCSIAEGKTGDTHHEEAFSFTMLPHGFLPAEDLAFPSTSRSVIDCKLTVDVQPRSPSFPSKARKQWCGSRCAFMLFAGIDCAYCNILNYSVSY